MTVTVSLLCSFLSSVTVRVNSYTPTSRPVTVATALSAFSIFTPSGPLVEEQTDRDTKRECEAEFCCRRNSFYFVHWCLTVFCCSLVRLRLTWVVSSCRWLSSGHRCSCCRPAWSDQPAASALSPVLHLLLAAYCFLEGEELKGN